MDLFRNHFQGMHVYSGFIGMSLGVSTETFLCKKIFRIHQGRMMSPNGWERCFPVFCSVPAEIGMQELQCLQIPVNHSIRETQDCFFLHHAVREAVRSWKAFSPMLGVRIRYGRKSPLGSRRVFLLSKERRFFVDYGIIKIPKENRKLIFLY